MRVKEWKGDVVFLHEVALGSADRSYGIHVGRLAGLPAAVVKRAEDVLGALEKSNQAGAVTKLAEDLPLFAHKPSPAAREETPSAATKLAVEIAKLRPDDLTPRDALEALYRLKALEAGE
jgi:DNA mismatch repair protein MutS